MKVTLIELPNAGLGNVLFAAMKELNNINDQKVCFCGLSRFHIGPYLRNEKNKRSYYRYFKRSIAFDYTLLCIAWVFKKLKMLSKFFIEIRNAKFPYPEDLVRVMEVADREQKFEEYFKNNLLKEKYIKYWNEIETASLCIHVRRGDFKVANMAKDMQYYEEVFERAGVQQESEGIIFTDEVDDLVVRMLDRFPNLVLFRGDEIESFLALGKTKKLIVTAGSSFGIMSWILNKKIALIYQ